MVQERAQITQHHYELLAHVPLNPNDYFRDCPTAIKSVVPLQGDKIVRLVYMDEAGISKATQEPFVVVAGVIIDASSQREA
jgi:hypothetical protein